MPKIDTEHYTELPEGTALPEELKLLEKSGMTFIQFDGKSSDSRYLISDENEPEQPYVAEVLRDGEGLLGVVFYKFDEGKDVYDIRPQRTNGEAPTVAIEMNRVPGNGVGIGDVVRKDLLTDEDVTLDDLATPYNEAYKEGADSLFMVLPDSTASGTVIIDKVYNNELPADQARESLRAVCYGN